jgi:hypothetical protein
VREIPASLPAIGSFRVHLHRESERVVDFFGEEELARLGRVDHLGVATAAFPGINHTRLEYVLLQCAITQLLTKLYKDNKDLALSNKVELDGLSAPISSGEELLKSWALLSNVGHANWTFGTERALLDGVMEDQHLRSWLLCGAIEDDLKRWATSVVDTYDAGSVRFLLTLLRVRDERPHDPRKHAFRQLVRNLVLDPDALRYPSPGAREKVSRLRHLFHQVRLLAMVTLDAYHSHSPLRLQLLPAIQELAESSSRTSGFEKFSALLRATAGWLADEVYMHPRAVAIQRDYELGGRRDALRRFAKVRLNTKKRSQFLRSVMADGFGRPSTKGHAPLIRLSFERFTDRLLGGGHRHDRLARLNSEISVRPSTVVSLDTNEFLRATHMDILYRPRTATASDIGGTFSRLAGWLLTATEAEALHTFRRFTAIQDRDDPNRMEATRRRYVQNRLLRGEHHLMELLFSVVDFLTPDGWSVNLEDCAGRDRTPPIGWRVIDSRGERYDQLAPRLERLATDVRAVGDSSRAHEVDTLTHVVKRRWRMLVVAALQPMVLRNHFGKKMDEWDGAILEVDRSLVRLTVIEAKGGSGKGSRTQAALRQLADTRTILKGAHSLPTRRKKVEGRGAYLAVDLWKADA